MSSIVENLSKINQNLDSGKKEINIESLAKEMVNKMQPQFLNSIKTNKNRTQKIKNENDVIDLESDFLLNRSIDQKEDFNNSYYNPLEQNISSFSNTPFKTPNSIQTNLNEFKRISRTN